MRTTPPAFNPHPARDTCSPQDTGNYRMMVRLQCTSCDAADKYFDKAEGYWRAEK